MQASCFFKAWECVLLTYGEGIGSMREAERRLDFPPFLRTKRLSFLCGSMNRKLDYVAKVLAKRHCAAPLGSRGQDAIRLKSALRKIQ
jgi:hypothetical protein